jgi:hypothetical protein
MSDLDVQLFVGIGVFMLMMFICGVIAGLLIELGRRLGRRRRAVERLNRELLRFTPPL